jgi:hypothetical protein
MEGTAESSVVPAPDGEAMSSLSSATGPLGLLARARADRRARRELARELADYGTPAQRDELEALIAGAGTADDRAARILRGQAQAQLFRVG